MATPGSGRIVTNPNKPGVIFVPELGEEFLLSKEREGIFYDTAELASGAQTKGNQLVFFQNFSNKNAQHFNIGKNGKLPSGNALAMVRTGFQILQCQGNTVAVDTDIMKVAYAGSAAFSINERIILKGEPLFTLPTGYGMAGMTTQNATGVITTGIPSAAAAPLLRNAQPVLDRDDLNSTVTLFDNSWVAAGSSLPTLASAVSVMHILAGVIKQPVAN